MNCAAPGCERPAEAHRNLCPGHRAQKRRGQELHEVRGWGQSTWDRLLAAFNAYQDAAATADSTAVFHRARRRLQRAIRRWTSGQRLGRGTP
jgi:hypothetical protein